MAILFRRLLCYRFIREQTLIAKYAGDNPSVTCSYSSGGCHCAISAQSTATATPSFTTAGTKIVYADASTVGYCVSGTQLTTLSTRISGITVVLTFHRTH